MLHTGHTLRCVVLFCVVCLLASNFFLTQPAHFTDFCLQGFSAAHYRCTLFILVLPHLDKASQESSQSSNLQLTSASHPGEAALIWQLTTVHWSVFLLTGHKTPSYHNSVLSVCLYESAPHSPTLLYKANPELSFMFNTTSGQRYLVLFDQQPQTQR